MLPGRPARLRVERALAHLAHATPMSGLDPPSHDLERRLIARFAQAYGKPPQALVRAPGRVNLIGEHVDYNGLPVLPIAIERAVRVAFRTRDDARVLACNVDASYAPREFEIAGTATFERGDWASYVHAAARALDARSSLASGLDLAVASDLPTAAGLSSSSALVVACTLALIAVNKIEIAPDELMEHCARAERLVGTDSGGMDQAISLGARAGHAALIEFDPIALTHVPVPSTWCFLIANSLVRAEKSGHAREAYNARTSECRAALAALLADPRARAWPRTWRGLVRHVATTELLEVARNALSDRLLRRFRHVVTEAVRVDVARRAMLASDASSFGAAMDASHASLRDDYAVSCDELDELVMLAREAGACGARLTGAGFGGCIVALCEADDVASLAGELERRFYQGRAEVPDRVLVAAPSAGAACEPIVT